MLSRFSVLIVVGVVSVLLVVVLLFLLFKDVEFLCELLLLLDDCCLICV